MSTSAFLFTQPLICCVSAGNQPLAKDTLSLDMKADYEHLLS